MPERPSALSVICVLWFLNSAIGARVAIKEGLPAEWVAGLYAGRDATPEFFKGGGTALSPGLPMMVVQALLTVLSTRGGKVGKSGAVGLTLLGAGCRQGTDRLEHGDTRAADGRPRRETARRSAGPLKQ